MQLKSEKCVGGKHSKVRLIGLAAGNAVGDKLPMLVIGKSKKTRFQNPGNRFQKKSWMDSTLFEEWVREQIVNLNAKAEKLRLLPIAALPVVSSNEVDVLRYCT